MKKFKGFLTIELSADVIAKDEEDVVEILRRCVSCGEISGIREDGVYSAKNVVVKRYWGGGNEVKDKKKK